MHPGIVQDVINMLAGLCVYLSIFRLVFTFTIIMLDNLPVS